MDIPDEAQKEAYEEGRRAFFEGDLESGFYEESDLRFFWERGKSDAKWGKKHRYLRRTQ